MRGAGESSSPLCSAALQSFIPQEQWEWQPEASLNPTHTTFTRNLPSPHLAELLHTKTEGLVREKLIRSEWHSQESLPSVENP